MHSVEQHPVTGVSLGIELKIHFPVESCLPLAQLAFILRNILYRVTWKTKQKNVVLWFKKNKNPTIKAKWGSQNKYAGPFYSFNLCVSLLMQVKPFTNQKVFSFHGSNIKQAFVALFYHLHKKNNLHTFASHHTTRVRPCHSHKLQSIYRTPLQNKTETKIQKHRTSQQERRSCNYMPI